MNVDGADANTATIAMNYASVISQLYGMEITNERNQRQGGKPLQIALDVRPRVLFNEEMESRNYIIPGLIAVLMMVISAMLTSLTIAREWERGTMEQLISTPIKVSELIVGKLIPYFAIGLFDVLVAVLMGEFVFHVPLRGNVALLFGTASIFLVGALAMGMTISIVTKNQLLSSQVAMVATFLPSFLLSGFIFMIANMPKAIQVITYIVPARYFIAILKGIYLKGVGWEILGSQIFLLAIYGVVMVTLARVKLRKKLV
jgi:ABC-2 type transport system permease protein